MLSKNFQHNFHLDPAPDGAAGGAANPGPLAGADAASAFDSSKFVPREDFERIQSDYTDFRSQAEQRFQDYDSRLPKAPKPEASEDKEPNAEDGSYDFSKTGEFQRYQRDLGKYLLKQEFSQRENQFRETQSQQNYRERVQGAQDAHAERANSFRAANPDYDPNKSILLGNDKVALSVLKSPYSAHIHNYLQKNPAKVNEIRKLAKSDPEDAILMVGMIAAQFENKTVAPLNPRAVPTKNSFGGGNAKASKRDTADIVKEWRMT